MFRVCGIDPGSTFTGLAYIDVTEELVIKKIYTRLVYVGINTGLNIKAVLDDRLIKLDSVLRDIGRKDDITVLSIETGFMNKSRPAAFRPLILVREIIEKNLSYNGINIYGYAPKHVKSRLGAKDDSKEAMTEALLNNKELSRYLDRDMINSLTEHEVDAIALAYVEILNTRKEGYSRWDTLLK